MGLYQYEWWDVVITDETGTMTWEFKGKDKEHVIVQINKAIKDTNSDENQARDIWHRRARILKVQWETLTLDRKGYQRRF